MGYKLAGYNVIGNVEIDKAIAAVYQANNHPEYSYNMDIRDFINMAEKPDALYKLDILDGSPPCSTFSMCGEREKGWGVEKQFREGQAKQRLDDLFFWFIELARQLQPKVIIAENVVGLLRGNARGYVNQILKAFDAAGFAGQIFKLNAATMGVPQQRERVFFIFHRKDLNYPKLSMNFRESPILFGDIRTPHGIAVDKDTLAFELLKKRREGDKDLCDIIMREECTSKRRRFNEKILADNKVANTMASSGQLYRMADGDLISVLDTIHIQSFPEDYNFMNQKPQYVCGMSVPPVMMANISAEVYKQWLAK